MVEIMTKKQNTSTREKGILTTGSVWESLQRDLLDLILDKLLKIDDYIRFGVVWRKHGQLVALNQQQQRFGSRHKQPPLMILTEQQQSGERSMTLRSATQDKTYKFQLKLNNVPNYDNMKYCESSHGWLAYAQGNLVAITLLNPFTGRTITLPPVRATGSYYIKKVVLSADPSSFPDDYQVLVIYNERVYNADTRIAHFKSGEDTWTLIDSGTTIRFTHAVCYKGQFLVCGGTNVDFSVFEVDVCRKRITQLMYGEQFVRRHEVMNTYLVESSKGDLLLVRRFHLLDIDRCLIVTVDKLIYDFGDDELTPIPIESIGSDALFLDRNQSICVSALDFPECHPKSIYFTDGIFSLESRQMHWFDSLKPTMSAIWISPTLCVENQPLPTCN